ncbi:GDP-mannose 4,6-dehydratase, partial [Candidatus Dependentiae bacterium]|nr:GDP-mannose 4,6-dehydratase [Candidatus Dependentiae bacterium]
PGSSHVIPALITKFFTAKQNNEDKVIVWGDGSASREFLYVEDAAEAIILSANLYNNSEPVNIGVGREISIKKLVETVKELIDYRGKIVWDKTKPNGQPRRCLDVRKAKEYFGFEAQTDFEEGLKKTIEWYKKIINN